MVSGPFDIVRCGIGGLSEKCFSLERKSNFYYDFRTYRESEPQLTHLMVLLIRLTVKDTLKCENSISFLSNLHLYHLRIR
jgi:hypothetical protein